MNGAGRPVAAQVCATFLKPEMLHIYRQVTALEGVEPRVVTLRRECAERFPFEGVAELGKPWFHGLRGAWCRWRGRPVMASGGEAKALETALRAMGARVAHIYFGHMGVYWTPWLRARRIPAVVSFHGSDAGVALGSGAAREALGEVFRLADRVLARSEAIRDQLLGMGCPGDKARVHRAGIPLEAFPASERAAPEGGFRWFQAGRLIEKKGWRTALRAFAVFLEQRPGSELVAAGEGPERAALESLARELGIAGAVRFAGFLDGDGMRAALAEAHGYLHPSETAADGDQEGVPNALLEAMATGLPCVATRHGGIPEALADGEGGFLVPERDPAALAAAMLRVADAGPGYLALSRGAAKAVREKFDLRATARDLASEYLALMGAS